MTVSSFSQPLLLSDNNLTPLYRTPWAGPYIRRHFKSHLNLQEDVGESWELSFDPKMPSKIETLGKTLFEFTPKLKELCDLSPSEGFDLLVKLISAGKSLSVQIHPDYDSPLLKEGESGKFESWYILHAEEGAGIYLGFKEATSRDLVEKTLKKEEDLSKLLNFIPVKQGDYFDIPPGTVHAIGAGVTLLEPQRTLFGKTGITYRFWDWDRKYDKGGNECPQGSKRDLHLTSSLKLLNLDSQCFPKVMGLKRKPTQTAKWSSGSEILYAENPYYKLQVVDLKEKGSYTAEVESYSHLFIIEGEGTLKNQKLTGYLSRHRSFLIPKGSWEISAGNGCIFTLVSPKT